MIMSDKPIRVVLSAASQDELNQMYPAFLADQGRVYVATMATTVSLLEDNLRQQGLEVAVLDADLLIERGESGTVAPQEGCWISSIPAWEERWPWCSYHPNRRTCAGLCGTSIRCGRC